MTLQSVALAYNNIPNNACFQNNFFFIPMSTWHFLLQWVIHKQIHHLRSIYSATINCAIRIDCGTSVNIGMASHCWYPIGFLKTGISHYLKIWIRLKSMDLWCAFVKNVQCNFLWIHKIRKQSKLQWSCWVLSRGMNTLLHVWDMPLDFAVT